MPQPWKPGFKNQDVKILDTKRCYDGFIQVHQLSLQFPLFKGGWSAPVLREVAKRPDAVAVLLYDPDEEQVVMIEQLRPGALNLASSPWLLEIVAGVIEPHDTPEQAAIREVFEETGLKVLSLTLLGHYLASPAIMSGKVFLYCATVKAPTTGGVFGLSIEAEDIKVHVFSVAEALEHLSQGHIVSAPAWIALQWLQIHQNIL